VLATLVMTGTASAHYRGAEGVQPSRRSNRPRQLSLENILGLVGGGAAGGQAGGQANGAADASDLRKDHRCCQP